MKTDKEWRTIVADLVTMTLDSQAGKWLKSGYLENENEFGVAIAVLTKQFNSRAVKNAIQALKEQ